MNFFGYDRLGTERAARLHREAAVEAIVRAKGTNSSAQTAARALRRLAESIDRQHQRVGKVADEISQPTLLLAMSEA